MVKSGPVTHGKRISRNEKFVQKNIGKDGPTESLLLVL